MVGDLGLGFGVWDLGLRVIQRFGFPAGSLV